MTKCISHSILRVLALTVLLMITTSVIPKTAAAATAVVGLGCSASSNGGNLTIPISSTVGEGDTILIAVQVVARNEDLVGITDAVGNTYTRLVKHLGIVIGPEGLQENDTHHVYAAFDASALNGGQTITVGWGFSSALEACVVKISGLYQSPFDQSASAHTNNTSPDSGNTVTTSLADEVLIGTFGWFCFPNSPCNADATAGAGYTEAIEGQDVMIEHRTVSTTGTYNANATLSASSDWNAAIVTFKVDTTPPVITPQVSGIVGQNGWYTSNVVVSWTVTDPESRVISTCSPTTISADTAGVQVTCNATSAGGTSTQSITVKRDATPPTITATAAPAPNGNGWNNSDVTVSFTCADAMSGLVGACPANQVLSTEGSTVNSTPQTVSDQAGNSVSSNVITVKIDKTAPVVSVIGVSDGATYDPDNVPTASCSTTDALSDVATQASLSVTGGGGPLGADGTGSFIATCSGATDVAGNSAAGVSVTYTVNPLPDSSAPVITPNVVGTLGDNGWYVGDVAVSWSVVDAESAISSQSGCDPVTVNADTSGATFTCSATSAGGNSSESVTIQRDATAPVVAVTGVSDGASYTLGSVPTAACDTSDVLSGVATQATVNVSGGNGDGTGSFTATCSGATDNAGNSAAPVSVGYSVESAGVLVGICGGYEVRQVGSSYSAAGWSGAIKVGTNGKNTLKGTNGPDLILGLGGNDKINGKGGDDLLCGGDGVDLLLGMAGNDYLDGGPGNDVLNGGSGDYDELLAGDGNDVLLDGDGVHNAAGGAGNDLFTLALRNGWRDGDGQARFTGLTAGYGNDIVGLAILNSARFLVDVSGDEHDNPPSPLEGNNDKLALAGVIDPASTLIKFEHQLVLSADATVAIPGEEAGAEYLTESVGDESSEEATLNNRLFLPLINR